MLRLRRWMQLKITKKHLKQLIKEEFKKSLWWGPPEGSGRPSHERTVEDQLGDLKQQLKTLAARVEALENPNRKEEEDIFGPRPVQSLEPEDR